MITLIITISGLIIIFFYSMFAGVITLWFNKSTLFKSNLTEPITTRDIFYHVIDSNIPLRVVGFSKYAKIIVSEKANNYFVKDSFYGLLLHEIGHVKNNYPIRRMIYVMMQWIIMYPIFSIWLGWWQCLLVFIVYRTITLLFNIFSKSDKYKQELLADSHAAKIMAKNKVFPALTKAFIDLPYLRESDDHPSINERIKKMYEAIQD